MGFSGGEMHSYGYPSKEQITPVLDLAKKANTPLIIDLTVRKTFLDCADQYFGGSISAERSSENSGRKKCSFTFPSKKEVWIPWLFLLPSLLGVSIFVLIPFADVVRRSFLNAVGNTFVGLENYKSVLENTAFQLAAGNTLHFLAVCLPLLLGSSLFFAILLLKAGKKSGILKSGFLLPMAVPAGSVVLFWQLFFDKTGF